MTPVFVLAITIQFAFGIVAIALQLRQERRGLPDRTQQQKAAARLRPIMCYPPVLRFLDFYQINSVFFAATLLPMITGRRGISIWAFAGISVVLFFLGTVWFFRMRRRISRFFDGLAQQEFLICPDCHYALVAHAQGGRCPECGYAFTPETLQADWADVKVLARPVPASRFKLFSWPKNGARR